MEQKVEGLNHVLFVLGPGNNGYRVTRDLSRGYELSNAFLNKSRRPELLQENILEGGQYLRRSVPNKLLKGRRDTWCKSLG